jgi:phage shock protein E
MKLLVTLLTLLSLLTGLRAADVASLTPQAAAQLVADGKAVLIDVREPSEWADGGVAAPAVLLAKSDFDGSQKQWKEFLGKNGDKQIILYCRSGRRSGVIAKTLATQGHNVANAGGFKEWQDAGLPTRKVEKSEK